MKVEFASLGREPAALPASAAAAHPVVAVMPFTDRAMAERGARQLASRAGAEGLLLAVEDADRQGFIAVVNHVFRHVTAGYVAYVAQDCFAGRQWLARGLAALRQEGKGLLGFNDGKWGGLLAGFGMVARDWAVGNYGGALFWPEYVQHYADTELTVLAMNQRQYCHDPHSVLLEVDWEKDRAAVNAADRALYRARAASGFDGKVTDERLLKLFS